MNRYTENHPAYERGVNRLGTEIRVRDAELPVILLAVVYVHHR
jgi:hypothetical protein